LTKSKDWTDLAVCCWPPRVLLLLMFWPSLPFLRLILARGAFMMNQPNQGDHNRDSLSFQAKSFAGSVPACSATTHFFIQTQVSMHSFFIIKQSFHQSTKQSFHQQSIKVCIHMCPAQITTRRLLEGRELMEI
jgi:hypothetical protein